MTDAALAALLAIGPPAASALFLAAWILLSGRRPSEGWITTLVGGGLTASLAGSVGLLALLLAGRTGEIDLGSWVSVGDYHVPLVLLIDHVAVVFSVLAAGVTGLTAWFSRTYLHKEPGYARFFVLLGLFATGAQLVALAGAFDLFFAGWELLGVSSALFIAFFFERAEPVRSGLRAFVTYRLCDMAFFLGIVATHETLGTTRLSVVHAGSDLPPWEVHALALLFLVAALGKSAQLPFSSWLPRAMDGPTPSSALFYGAVSIHAGLFLMLRIWPLLDAAPAVAAIAIAIGLLTALYATIVARTHADAKGALAKATLAQTGLILAEIAAGLTTLALVHLVGHALLRLWQFLRTPNTLNDAHRRGHAHAHEPAPLPLVPASWSRVVFARAVHRFRLDDAVDAAVAPALVLARQLDRVDRAWRAAFSLEAPRPEPIGPEPIGPEPVGGRSS